MASIPPKLTSARWTTTFSWMKHASSPAWAPAATSADQFNKVAYPTNPAVASVNRLADAKKASQLTTALVAKTADELHRTLSASDGTDLESIEAIQAFQVLSAKDRNLGMVVAGEPVDRAGRTLLEAHMMFWDGAVHARTADAIDAIRSVVSGQPVESTPLSDKHARVLMRSKSHFYALLSIYRDLRATTRSELDAQGPLVYTDSPKAFHPNKAREALENVMKRCVQTHRDIRETLEDVHADLRKDVAHQSVESGLESEPTLQRLAESVEHETRGLVGEFDILAGFVIQALDAPLLRDKQVKLLSSLVDANPQADITSLARDLLVLSFRQAVGPRDADEIKHMSGVESYINSSVHELVLAVAAQRVGITLPYKLLGRTRAPLYENLRAQLNNPAMADEDPAALRTLEGMLGEMETYRRETTLEPKSLEAENAPSKPVPPKVERERDVMSYAELQGLAQRHQLVEPS